MSGFIIRIDLSKMKEYVSDFFSSFQVTTHGTSLIAACSFFLGFMFNSFIATSTADIQPIIIDGPIVEVVSIAPVIVDIPLRTKQFDEKQVRVLRLAYDIGSEIGYPETIQAIVLQETIAGKFGNRVGDRSLRVGKRSYGVAQVKVATVRYVFHNYPAIKSEYYGKRKLRKITDEELIVLMLTDDEANIVVATWNFKLMLKKTVTWTAAVVAYNQGLGGMRRVKDLKNFKYIKHIRKQITKYVRPFNIQLELVDVAAIPTAVKLAAVEGLQNL